MSRIEPGCVQFIGDDEAYLAWVSAHPYGFVVNSARIPKPSYLMLHRSSCKFINSPDRSNWTSADYIKTCAEQIELLAEWARQRVGGDLQPCEFCKPGLDSDVAAIRETQKTGSLVDLTAFSPQRTRQLPPSIATGCRELDLVWKTFAADIVGRPHVLIADTEDELNWHAFLGHSIDMQGFRAAEFVGVDPLSKPAPGFVTLKARGIGVAELGGLWEVPEIRAHLLEGAAGAPLQTSLDALRRFGGEVGHSLADAFEKFPYRKGHWTVRAYLQNSAALEDYGYSFRNWLKAECEKLGASAFPPSDFRAMTGFRSMSLEMALRDRLEKTFHRVGPALAAYMLCDWQLGLWYEGKTEVFANFKLDSFHEEFINRFGKGKIPADERGFADWWLSLYPDLPPRLANECIWIGMEKGIV